MAELERAVGDAVRRHEEAVDARQTFRKGDVLRKRVRGRTRRLGEICTNIGKNYAS